MTMLKLSRLIGIIAGAVLAVATPVLAAPMAFVTSSFTGDVSVIDTTTKEKVATIPVGGSPFGVAVHPAGSHVYVANWGDDTVSVISTATNSVVRTIPVGDGPFGVAVHPAGTHVYVANQLADTVSVIDTATGTAAPTPIGVGSRPVGVVVNPAGTRLYVVNQWSFTVSVIDTTSNTLVDTVGVGGMPVGIAVAPNGSRVYVTNASAHRVSVIDTATNTVVTTVAVGSSPFGIAVHPSGSHVYVGNGSGTVSVIDAATNTVVASPFAASGLLGVGVTPSGTHVYAASEDANAVFVLATSTNTVTDRIEVDSGPAAFGIFIASHAVCETEALEAALAACQGELATSMTRISQLEAENATLASDYAQLSNQQGGLVRALVSVLFGDRPDAAVTEAVRDATGAELAVARGAAPQDPRLRQAQRAFDTGQASMLAQDWTGAMSSFRNVYTLTRQIQAEVSVRGRKMGR